MTDYAVVDLGFGDAGKGALVDFLCRTRATGATVVRFNGGCQAFHLVREAPAPNARERAHGFSQFGSGTLAGARTHLSRFMLVNPENMLNEADVLRDRCRVPDLWERLTIDPNCLVTTHLHRAWNRLVELWRGNNRHGSCGQGIGATVEYSITQREMALRCRDLADPMLTRDKLHALRRHYHQATLWHGHDFLDWLEHQPVDAPARLAWGRLLATDIDATAALLHDWHRMVAWRDDDLLADVDQIVYEGAQGALLDEDHGFQPHTTWSKCTDLNARQLAVMCGRDEPFVLGATRSYQTRHGAGPFPTEADLRLYESDNGDDPWQGGWRTGFLDLCLLRYALSQCELVDGLAVHHLDQWPGQHGASVCTRYVDAFDQPVQALNPVLIDEYRPVYERYPEDPGVYAKTVADALGVPLAVTGYGPTAEDRTWQIS